MTVSTAAHLIFDARAALGEGPVWDTERRCLWWVDITAGIVHRFDPDTGDDRSARCGQPVGALALTAGEELLLATAEGFASMSASAVGEDRPDADVETVVPLLADEPDIRFNDGKPDPQGRFWAGTAPRADGRLYRLDHDRTATVALEPVAVSNGIDWTDDGATMLYIDSGTGGVDAFDFDEAGGTLSRRRRVIDVHDATPDGMTLDAEGCLWVALWGGGAVRRYRPDGRIDRELRLPVNQVTSCAFGGADLDLLFVTSAAQGLDEDQLAAQPEAGGLFVFEPGVTGRPPNRFLG